MLPHRAVSQLESEVDLVELPQSLSMGRSEKECSGLTVSLVDV